VNPVLGPFAIAATILAVAGASKVLEPRDTAGALRVMGLPGGDRVVRVGGVVEVVVAAAALVATGVVVALLVALSYGLFAAFIAVALVRRLPIASCGCVGRAVTFPSRVHVGLNVAACLAALGMAFDPSVTPLEVVRYESVAAVAAFVALVLAGVVLFFRALTQAPRPAARA
jgi:Methylamine utilisation protein MauE